MADISLFENFFITYFTFIFLVDFYQPCPKKWKFLRIMVDYQLGPGVTPPLRLLPPLDGGKEDPVLRV